MGGAIATFIKGCSPRSMTQNSLLFFWLNFPNIIWKDGWVSHSIYKNTTGPFCVFHFWESSRWKPPPCRFFIQNALTSSEFVLLFSVAKVGPCKPVINGVKIELPIFLGWNNLFVMYINFRPCINKGPHFIVIPSTLSRRPTLCGFVFFGKKIFPSDPPDVHNSRTPNQIGSNPSVHGPVSVGLEVPNTSSFSPLIDLHCRSKGRIWTKGRICFTTSDRSDMFGPDIWATFPWLQNHLVFFGPFLRRQESIGPSIGLVVRSTGSFWSFWSQRPRL